MTPKIALKQVVALKDGIQQGIEQHFLGMAPRSVYYRDYENRAFYFGVYVLSGVSAVQVLWQEGRHMNQILDYLLANSHFQAIDWKVYHAFTAGWSIEPTEVEK